MKKIVLAITCAIILTTYTGCSFNKNEFEVGNKSNVVIEEKGITFQVKENTLTKTGAFFILKNNSDVDVQYGNPYELEIKKDGVWHKINVELYFTLPAFSLNSKESKEFKINWEHGYGKLAKGDYRIIKSIDVETDEGTFDTFYVSAEFTIK